MELIIVRHGHPEVPTEGHSGNPPLSARGVEQARHTASVLQRERIDRIISSGMRRADATAQPLADALGLPIETNPDLGEIDRWGGMYANVETIKQKGPEELERFRAAPLAYFGVDADRFRRETLSAFRKVVERHGDATVAIFTHGFPINILFLHVHGIGHAQGGEHDLKYVPSYGAISRISGELFDDLNVISWNENGHIPETLK